MIETHHRNHRLVLSGIGLIQGLTYYFLSEWQAAGDPHLQAVLAAVAAFATVLAVTLEYAWMPGTGLRLVPIGAIEALVLAVLTYWVWDQVPGGSRLHYGDDYRLMTWSVASFVIVYVSMPYIQIFQRTSRFSFPYADLYRYSWGNFYIGIIGSGVAGLYWILVEVSAGLFRALGITAIQEIVHEDWFPLVTIPMLMGLGIAIGKENDRTIDRLRDIFATTFRVLFPMLAAIVLSFICVLPVTGLTPLWDTKWASAILLAVLLLVVLFINAVYQDGDTAVIDRPWYRRGLTAVIVAMPVFTVLSLYSLTLRIDQYGFTPDRLYALIFAGVLGLYGLGYGLAVLRCGGKWLTFLQPVNIALSLVVAGLAALLHTPVLDPLRLSADSQYRRLASGEARAATFDFGTLRFDLGHAGHEKLQALRRLSAHPERAIIAEQVEAIGKIADPWNWKQQLREASAPKMTAEIFELRNASRRMPEGLLTKLDRLREPEREHCIKHRDCVLVARNLDQDTDDEYVLVTGARPSNPTTKSIFMIEIRSSSGG